MSEMIPQFNVGDRVRLMDTPDHRRWGMANLRGTVRKVRTLGMSIQRVSIQTDGGSWYVTDNCSLMSVTPEQEAHWEAIAAAKGEEG